MKIKVICFLLSIFIASFTLYAKYAEEIDSEYLMRLLKSSRTKEAMTYLKEKLHSDDKTTRSGVYNVMGNWIFPKNPEYRKEIVEIWTSSLKDTYSRDRLYKYLYNASPVYYSETAKKNILDYAKDDSGNIDGGCLLLGHANVTEAIPLLKAVAEKYEPDIKAYQKSVGKFKKENPNANLPEYILRGKFKGGNSGQKALPYHEALARMGDKGEIDYCINYFNQKVKRKAILNHKNNPELSLEEYMERSHISNVKNYAYIRQPETIKLLNKALLTKATYNMQGKDIPLNKDGFDALVKCLMIEDVLRADRFGKYFPHKENIALLQKWMKEHYSPEKIKSLSVLINGQIVNNYASAGTAIQDKKHTAPLAKIVKPEVVKAETKPVSKVKTPEPDVASAKLEKANNMKYIYLVILVIGAVFITVLIKRKKK